MNVKELKYAYFIGIGGIGMSAIARYFHAAGIRVSGYDKTPSDLTAELELEGISITYLDDPAHIPEAMFSHPESSIFIYTPAIPKEHKQWNYLLEKQIEVYKRSEVLGMISRESFCIAVAGTHGKTTTSAMIAHMLHTCNVNFTAFLGGISSNYNSNYLHFTKGKNLFEDRPIIVLEADEFDRSFHRLNPDIAVITAIDPDHLDIYETEDEFRKGFHVFAEKIKAGGKLVAHENLRYSWPSGIHTYYYGSNDDSHMQCHFRGIENHSFTFDFKGNLRELDNPIVRHLENLKAGLPGFHNALNATAAIGVCHMLLKTAEAQTRQAVQSFSGVKRRFEYIHRSEKHVAIDDYAHHPQELKAVISSVRELYPDKKLTAIFQPHLFSRTRDFADGFAEILSQPDEIILMDIYPARELPMPGVTSSWLLSMLKNENKSLLNTQGILEKIRIEKPELLLILGAGDIDRIVPKVKEVYATF